MTSRQRHKCLLAQIRDRLKTLIVIVDAILTLKRLGNHWKWEVNQRRRHEYTWFWGKAFEGLLKDFTSVYMAYMVFCYKRERKREKKRQIEKERKRDI